MNTLPMSRVLQLGSCVMALLVPWWCHIQSWRLRISFQVGHFTHHILVGNVDSTWWHLPFPLQYGGWVAYMETNLENFVKYGTLLLTTHENKLPKLVPGTKSRLWHPIDSRWGHDWCLYSLSNLVEDNGSMVVRWSCIIWLLILTGHLNFKGIWLGAAPITYIKVTRVWKSLDYVLIT